MDARALLVAVLALGAIPASATAAVDVPVLGVIDALEASQGLDPGARVATTLRAIADAEGTGTPAAAACPSLSDALALHAGRLGIAAPALRAPIVPDLERTLGCLLGALHAANLAMDATFAGRDMAEILARADGDGPALADLVEGLDHRANLRAAIGVADAVSAALPVLDLLQTSGAPIDLRPILYYDDAGTTTHVNNYVLIVDQAGDDTYDNNAGGVFAGVGAGIWDVGPGTGFVQTGAFGANVHVGGKTQDADAVLSAGLVIDTDGNDVYGVKHPPMLKDIEMGCATEDVVPWVGTVGGGVIGTGMLFDTAGDNTYVGRTQTQGAGHIMGVGVLSTGEGIDVFEAVRATQGSGLLGGIGILIDEGGVSEYRTYSPAGGVFNSDLSICDAEERYSQGSSFDRRAGPAAHGIGILYDQGGDDVYDGGILAQGFGQGIGFALLLDEVGADSYNATDRAQGAAQGRSAELNPQAPPGGGQGILVDREGDDTYTLSGTGGQGWALGHPVENPPPTDPVEALLWARDRNEAVGILRDEGGSDTYSGPSGRLDGAQFVDGVVGLFSDVA